MSMMPNTSVRPGGQQEQHQLELQTVHRKLLDDQGEGHRASCFNSPGSTILP
jgi:hypothetical protein